MLKRRRPTFSTMLVIIGLTGVQLVGQAAPAAAGGAPVCAEVSVGADLVMGAGVETPEVCPYVNYEAIVASVVPPDPGIWAALPPTAKSVFKPARSTMGPNVFEPNVGTTLLPSSLAAPKAACGAFTITVKEENTLGAPLWAYHQRLGYCFDGEDVISLERKRWGEATFPGWTFEGHVASAKSGHAPAPTIERYTKGRFSFGVPPYVFLEYQHPWIDMTVNGDGSTSSDTGVE